MNVLSFFFLAGFLAEMVLVAATPTELLVKWKGGPGSEEARAANARIGATPGKNFNEVGWQLVRLPEGMEVAEGLAQFRGEPNVQWYGVMQRFHFVHGTRPT